MNWKIRFGRIWRRLGMKCDVWKKIKLEEIGKIVTGKTPKTSNLEYYGGDIPFLTPSDDMSVKHVSQTKRTLTFAGKQAVGNMCIPADSVCVSCIGSDLGKVVITTQETVTNQQINSIIVDKTRFDVDFIYYAMLILGRELNYLSKTSTAVPIVNKSMFSKCTIDCPDLTIQKKIASILSALDDKIENNKIINKNLEQQALAIFEEWFISPKRRLDYWEVHRLDELSALISRGICPKYDDESQHIVINQKCIRNHSIDLSLARRHLPKRINEKWIRKGDILINSTGTGTLGRVAQVWFHPQNITVDSHVTIVRPLRKEIQFYLGFWALSHEREIEDLHTGSTGQTELPRDRVKEISLILPDSNTLNHFNAIVEPIIEFISDNRIENDHLSLIRDLLLVRFMSGDIDISSIENK